MQWILQHRKGQILGPCWFCEGDLERIYADGKPEGCFAALPEMYKCDTDQFKLQQPVTGCIPFI